MNADCARQQSAVGGDPGAAGRIRLRCAHGMTDPVTGEIIDQKELAERLLAQAKEQGVSLVGPGGLLNQLTRNVLETALEAELTEHLGHERHGTAEGPNVRNGSGPRPG